MTRHEQIKKEISERSERGDYWASPAKLAEYLRSLEERIEKLEGCSVTIAQSIKHENGGVTTMHYDDVVCPDCPDQKSVWEPKIGSDYFYLTDRGEIKDSNWSQFGNKWDFERRDFIGVFPTREEAEAMRDRIKYFLKTSL